MQKISTFLSATALTVMFPAFGWADVIVEKVALAACFEERERLTRLECYDTLLERPQIQDTVPLPDPLPKAPVVGAPMSLTFARELLSSPEKVGDTIAITMTDRETGSPVWGGEGGLIADLKTHLEEDADRARKAENDLYLAMGSLPDIGEEAILVVACENDITRLKLVFPTPFQGKFAEARFYGADSFSQTDGEWRKMWVRGGGYMLENARGLDSIRLIQHISSGALGQISIGKGDDIRSAFFSMPKLTEALPLIAHHCSWISNPGG